MTTEKFLKVVCPNHTDKSKWNKSELLHILELHTEQLRKHAVVRSTYKYADPKLKFNCPMCKNYYENNLNKGKVINRCCPSCASELPSI